MRITGSYTNFNKESHFVVYCTCDRAKDIVYERETQVIKCECGKAHMVKSLPGFDKHILKICEDVSDEID